MPPALTAGLWRKLCNVYKYTSGNFCVVSRLHLLDKCVIVRNEIWL
ncbi:hypothetical protein CLOSTASPAR_02040 [[Clostridium] asparagiforme DSM 15981]|uniref:Uncharacterized protein n=1 Tax=[Clostridium] asparagiforme DSM 15981 TaxID=518636 RepID=C0CYG4_9FIRM|nr:hypothetical protein CLOSTASPAR_02040 [[Clostridium] asparagiforme DSM 15981]